MFCLDTATDPEWAREAMRSFGRLLQDHAHCELKAASNALSLIARHPGELAMLRALTHLAREEMEHLDRVIAFLEKRGLALGPPQVDAYAQELRRRSTTLPGSSQHVLTDRLLVSALIEARSCERFKLLLDEMTQDPDAELVAFYRELFEAEAGHYRTYVDLAALAEGGNRQRAEARLAQLAKIEGEIVRKLADGTERATIHG